MSSQGMLATVWPSRLSTSWSSWTVRWAGSREISMVRLIIARSTRAVPAGAATVRGGPWRPSDKMRELVDNCGGIGNQSLAERISPRGVTVTLRPLKEPGILLMTPVLSLDFPPAVCRRNHIC